jgi:hypothetical protein
MRLKTATDHQPVRQRILETAQRLFYRDGFRAVGIDTIISEAGVAKMSLYRHFPSKDDSSSPTSRSPTAGTGSGSTLRLPVSRIHRKG